MLQLIEVLAAGTIAGWITGRREWWDDAQAPGTAGRVAPPRGEG